MTQFGEYLPDQPGDTSSIIAGKNVYPCSNGLYGPVGDFAATVATVAARVQGSSFAIDKDYNVSAYCGTASVLYKLAGGGSSWTDVKKLGGYSTAAADAWEFTQFGNKIVATNFADPIQVLTLTGGTAFADLSATAPKARHMATVNRFLMVGNTNDGTDGNQPSRVWWSAIDDPTNWPTPATSSAASVQSGYQTLFGNGGGVQGFAPKVGALDAIILQERALIRCQYIGSPDVFALQPLEGARGCPAPGSITVIGGVCYYLGEDGFYACDGSQSVPIGTGRVDETFWADVNQNFLYRINAVYSAEDQIWLVGYPSLASATGNIDRILSYNVMTKRWAPPWQITVEHISKLGTVGYTLEQLDAFGTLDSLPASLDSRQWTGSGKPIVAAFNTSHALGFFSGQNLQAELETGDADGGGQRFLTQGIRPLLRGTTSGAIGSSNVTCKVGYRDTKDALVSYTTPTSVNRTGVCPTRINARYTRAVVTIAAGATWRHMQGFEFYQGGGGSL